MKTAVWVFLFLALASFARAEDDVWIKLIGSGKNTISVPERAATTRLVNLQDLLLATDAEAVSWTDITTNGGTVFRSYVRGLSQFPSPLIKGEAYILQGPRRKILELHSNPQIVAGQKLIAFVSDRQSKTATKVSRLHLMNEDGSEQRAMFPYDDLNQLDPTWDPTGEFVYWAQQEVQGDNRMFSIFRARPDGTGMLRMTNTNPDGSFNGVASPNSLPRLSWDGKYLFYVKLRVSGFSIIEGDLIRQHLEGAKEVVNLTPDTLGSDDETPVPSPDAKYVFFTSNRGGSYQVWRMDWDGTNLVQLTTNPISSGVSDVSSQAVLFVGPVSGVPKIFLMDITGSNQHAITTESYYQDTGTFIKARPNRICFESNESSNLEIYTMKDDGSRKSRLTFNSGKDVSASMQP